MAKKAPKNLIIFGADISKLQKELNKAKKYIRDVGKEVDALGKSFTKLSAPLAAFGASAVVSFDKVTKAMNSLRVGTGALGQSFDSLKKSVAAVSSNSASSIQEISDIVGDLNTRLGISGESVEKFADQISKLSRMVGEGGTSLSTGLSEAFKAWDISVDDAAHKTDMLFVAYQNTGTAVTSLSSILSQNAGVLKKFNLSFDQSLSMIQKFQKAGVSAENVISAMRMALLKLSAAGVKDLRGGLESILSAIQKANTDSEALSIGNIYFGEQSESVVTAIRKISGSITELDTALISSTGAIDNTSKATETFRDRIQKLLNSAQLSSSKLGEALTNLAEAALKDVLGLFKGMSAEVSNTAIKLGLVLTAVGPVNMVLSSLIGTLSSVIGSFSSLIKTIVSTGSVAKGLLAVLSGPAGVAAILTTVVAGAMYGYISNLQNATGATEELIASTRRLKNEAALMTASERAGERDKILNSIQQNESELKKYEDLRDKHAPQGIDSDGNIILDDSQDGRTDKAYTESLKKIQTLKANLAELNKQLDSLDSADRFETTKEALSGILEEFNDTIKDSKVKLEDVQEEFLAVLDAAYEKIDVKERQRFQGMYDSIKSSIQNAKRYAQAELPKIGSISSKSSSSNSSFKYRDTAYKGITDLSAYKQAVANNENYHRLGIYSDKQYGSNLITNLSNISALSDEFNVEDEWLKASSALKDFADNYSSTLVSVIEAGNSSWNKAQSSAKAFVDECIKAGVKAPESIAKLADGTTEIKTQMDALKEAGKNALDSIADGLADCIIEGNNFGDILKSVGKQLIRLALTNIKFGDSSTSTGGNFFSSLFGGLFGARHSGGIVGVDRYSFSKSLNIPKFHTGGIVGSNEELAILKDGEGVFTAEQMKRLQPVGSSGSPINITVNNNGQGNMSDTQVSSMGRQIRDLIDARFSENMYRYKRQGYFGV